MIKFATFIEEKPVLRTLVDERGKEVLDPTPVSIPFKQQVPPSSMMELIHRLYQQMSQDKEVETFDDADDFDVDDESGIEMELTPYEKDFDHLAGNTASSAEPSAVPDKSENEVKE